MPEEYLHSGQLPSAPLRAFSYTQAGGSASCGKVGCVSAIFKCRNPSAIHHAMPR